MVQDEYGLTSIDNKGGHNVTSSHIRLLQHCKVGGDHQKNKKPRRKSRKSGFVCCRHYHLLDFLRKLCSYQTITLRSEYDCFFAGICNLEVVGHTHQLSVMHLTRPSNPRSFVLPRFAFLYEPTPIPNPWRGLTCSKS